jgi:hypothetical protein
MNSTLYRLLFAGACSAALSLASVAHAAESGDKGEAARPDAAPSSIEKLVANQPATPAAASADPTADKPMTINFSDFVKDGAGCGVPNLDTTSK